MKKSLLVFVVIPFLFACNSAERSTQKMDSTLVEDGSTYPPDDHNSRNSVDWQGMYSGTLPCADCEGIRMTLTLQDSTYRMIQTYLVKDSFSRHSEGKFNWSDDGSTVRLLGVKDAPDQYKVGENKLIQLDGEGNLIKGTLADLYILTKASSPILDITWKLSELDGKLVEVKGIKPFNLIFDTTIGFVQGYAGCNGISGEFTVKGDSLHLFGLFRTEMACEPLVMDIESGYIKALEELDGFALEEDVLLLKKGSIVLAKLVKE